MKATKLSSGNWRCRAYLGEENGKKIVKSFTAPTKKQAEQMAQEYALSHSATDKLFMTFSQLANHFINNRDNVLAPGTERKYRGYLKSLEKNYSWFTCKVSSKITKDDLQQLINELTPNYAPRTVKNTVGFIKVCMNDVNTFTGLNLPRIDDTEIEIPTDEEIKKLMSIVKDTEMEIPCMLGAYCMMRRGEISALTIDDINFDKCEITINKGYVKPPEGGWILSTTKTTYSKRVIPVRKEVCDRIKEKGYVTHMNPNKLTDMFERYCKRANLPEYHFHCLRHYCCSVFSLTCPIHYIKFYGGWGESKTVERIYQHVMRDKTNEIYSKALSHFDFSEPGVDTKVDTEEIKKL